MNAEPTRSFSGVVLCAVAFALAVSSSAFASTRFLLITSDLEVVPIRLAGLDEQRLHYTELTMERRMSVPLSACIAIVRERPATASTSEPGMLRLSDGRQFPGEPAVTSRSNTRSSRDVFAWHSSWLGRMEVRFDDIELIVLRPSVVGGRAPFDATDRQFHEVLLRSDLVQLANGDILEGFVASIQENVSLETEREARVVEIPLDRVAAIRMVAPPREDSPARRAWLADGTIMNVSRIELDEAGGARLSAEGVTGGTRLDLRHVSAVLLSPQRLVPLAARQPTMVSGPETRYTTPEPRRLETDAMLGLAPIELRGPLRIEYELPEGASRFACKVVLPESSRIWGDFEIVVGDGQRELERNRLSAAMPETYINVPIDTRTLTIELTAGPHGPIQNHAVLKRPMILVD